MRCYTLAIALLLFLIVSSCKKESIITSADALLRLSEDTLHFDTVFTSTGSTTQFFHIYNPNNQKLILSSVQLMGGSNSFFKMNIDGFSGTNLPNIEIAANDSIYGFVTVSINPNSASLPFVVRDSIQINCNGNNHFLQLEAYGQNARFLRNATVTKDTTWTNTLPIVLLGVFTVNDGKTLTINKGTKVYLHADAPMLINGTMKAIGEKYDSTRISFQSDRIDSPYNNYPGAWPGIYFTQNSNNNIMQYCIIKNAYQGTIAQSPASSTKLTLNECILDNIYDIAIGGNNSSIAARNCLISNCGYNLYITSGGNYSFNHCTFVTIGNTYIDHKNSAVTLSNTNSSNQINPLAVTIQNSIIYGEGGLANDEITLAKNTTAAFNVLLTNVLYKTQTDITTNATITNSIKNQLPEFDSIDVGNRYFNFRLKATSPCINKGVATGVMTDLDGNPRIVGNLPDLGCYEKQ
jgi:hypothetical protein